MNFCACCDTECPAFLDWSPDYRNVVCPNCDSHPRHRLFWMFVQQRGLLRGKDLRVLHFAPEPMLRRLISSSPGVVTYTTGDREQPGVDIWLDVTGLPCPDECFDVVLCSGVLSVVPEDRMALSELFRVLRPGGWAWIQVGLDNERATTLEDQVDDPKERERLYWDEHNIRRYGRDFADRVRAAGFSFVEEDFTRKNLSPDEARRCGLDPAETLYFGTRGAALGASR